ncbi:dUTP diphosphatase [Brachybacterium alimentarium]|uniref:dUTP diphosphatase n=1 Tax=Brachybacterium alimentarium TaxID=47845 RepID=A0A2A3YL19_9MICO|nr:dUTP diphosphatase [Brachybacterium alimentarium]PCC34282.1 deoxyuridine 5'-triphosphate nucleotidohydrolase [Brachybacterium alimentarium]PCC39919.1 deoxyuridine 5'-triphosphate nucleotidohydrolase [Brachybacterium alimentarium]RCS69879.1 dUTP diphosphatase [Brachybacterium alimentarium]RCS83892.1 dUTP diphosphatase [Brachybacterium alimentarium]
MPVEPDTLSAAAAGAPDPTAAAPLRIRLAPGGTMPERAHADDAGLDLTSAEDVEIPAGGRALVDTGMAVALPAGTVGLVCPRSGLAAKHGVTVLNGPGVVDAGYRGHIKVSLHNTDLDAPFALRTGDRIAQLVVVPFLAPVLQQVDDLDTTDRAASGFGSSGGFGHAPATAGTDENPEG